MPSAGFKHAISSIEHLQTLLLDCTVTGIHSKWIIGIVYQRIRARFIKNAKE